MAETDLDKFISADFSSLDGDDSWLPEFTTADAEALYNEEDQVNDVEDAPQSNPKKKRKTEILGVLKGYADELQKKRKVSAGVDDDCSVNTLDADNTKKRLEIFDPIMEAFNTGDFDLMSSIMKEHCRRDCEFKAAYIKPGLKGAVPLMVFFGLLHEAYPDAMVKILDRRISSTKKPLSKLFDSAADEIVQRVDYVYKIVGTRISTRPLPSVYNKVIDGLMAKENLTQDEVSCAISGLLTSNNSASSDGECSYIVETGLSFDQYNKIIEWTYEILAFDVR